MTLESRRQGPEAGHAERAVVLLHGYGADGADLIGLAEPLAPHLPGTVFLAPDAPEPCAAAPAGRQWFPIPQMDGSSPIEAGAALARSAAALDRWLDEILTAEGLAPDHLLVFGFSQGAMMALHVVPARARAVAGIVGFSGRLIYPEGLAARVRSHPPVWLGHGDQDPVVPFSEMAAAETALTAAGFEVTTQTMPDTAHGIAPEALGEALRFMRARLGV